MSRPAVATRTGDLRTSAGLHELDDGDAPGLVDALELAFAAGRTPEESLTPA